MGRPKTAYPDLPPCVTARKSGGRLLYYYTRGGRKIPLGSNEDSARRGAARLAITEDLRACEARNYDLLTAEEIIAEAQAISKVCGIYFLIRAGKVIYVGQSVDIEDRVREHEQSDREFDSYSWVPCLPEDMRRMESAYIILLNPEGNVQRPPTKHRIRFSASGDASLDLRNAA